MSGTFSIASWNLFQGLHYSSRRKRWVQNLPIVDHLAALDADVLVLPEAWRFGRPQEQWAEQIAERLGYELHQWLAVGPSRPREIVPFRMIILTRIPARRLDDWVLPKVGALGQRAMVRIELLDHQIRITGVHLWGVHLLLNRHPRRFFEERSELRAAAAETDVLAGDFNLWATLVNRDALPLRPAVTGRTFPVHRPHSQIDHILVGDRLNVVDAQIMSNQGSDHKALRATLEVKGQAG